MKIKFIEKSFFWIVIFLLIFIASSCCSKKSEVTVSVNGIGAVTAEPDMAEIFVSLTFVAPTTRQAQEEVNRMSASLLEIFKKTGIEDRNIRTASLSFRPEYEYGNNRVTLAGQRVEQTIAVTIHEINAAPGRLSGILDEITSIDRVILQQIEFGIKDRSSLFSQSRELAYKKALEKATQYASLAGFKTVKPVSILEFDNNDFVPLAQNRFADSLARTAATNLPTGELEVTSQVTVVFVLR